MFSHWLWEETRELSKFEAFLDLLQLAAFEPTKRIVSGSVIQVPIGGIVASERFLSERWKWSRTKVRHFLGMLESEQMMNQQKDQGNTILVLSNYASYNDPKTTKEPPKRPVEDHRETTQEPNIRTIRTIRTEESTLSQEADHWPTMEQVKTFSKSDMTTGITEQCAESFWNDCQSSGWINRQGHPLRDWRPALRNYARRWNENERNRKTKSHQNPDREYDQGKQNDLIP